MSCCGAVLAGSIWLKRWAAASSQSLICAPFTFTAYTVLGYRYKSAALLMASGPAATSV